MRIGDIVARTVSYNMEGFLSSCVDRYLELAENGVKLKTVAAPFLNEGQGTSPQGAPCESGTFCECPWCKHTFPANVHKPAKDVSWNRNKGKALANVRQDATHQTSDRKLYALSELIEIEYEQAESGDYHATPAQDRQDHGGTPSPALDTGRLQPIAAKVLMKILYAARLCRFDLLRAVCHLATFVTKRTSECDRKLHRLVCYINSSKHLRMIGWVGDDPSALQPHLFADADFAGCTATQRSTSGYHFAIRGPNTCFPITGVTRKQACVSHSTPEAEIVSADLALRHSGLPGFALWWTLLPQKPRLMFHEDNQTMIRVVETGRNPTTYALRTLLERTVSLSRGCMRHSPSKTLASCTRSLHACVLISAPKLSLTQRSGRLCVISSTLWILNELGSSCLSLALTLAKAKTSIVLSKLNLMPLPCPHRLPPTQLATTTRRTRTGHGIRLARPSVRHLILAELTRHPKRHYKPFSVGGSRKIISLSLSLSPVTI